MTESNDIPVVPPVPDYADLPSPEGQPADVAEPEEVEYK